MHTPTLKWIVMNFHISSLLSEDATEPPSVHTAWASGEHATCQLLFEGDIRMHDMADASKEMEGFS